MLRETALGDLEEEFAHTRRLLTCIPDGHLEWRPHTRSWKLGELATHLANLPTWQIATLTTDGMDLESAPRQRTTALASRDEILSVFDRNVSALLTLLTEASDEVLSGQWSMRRGEAIIWSRKRVEVFREWGINHMIHHRGQLTVYLRLLEVPLPGIYGPTADEIEAQRKS